MPTRETRKRHQTSTEELKVESGAPTLILLRCSAQALFSAARILAEI
jgi:hypothetical protein